MRRGSTADLKRLTVLKAELRRLESALAQAREREGGDSSITVGIKKNQGRFERVRHKESADTAMGKYYLEIAVTAPHADVYIPISIASGKRVAGFMYQIEGTAASSLVSAQVEVRGEAVSQITLGTVRYAKIPQGKAALFRVQVVVRGKFGNKYTVVCTRINYKLDLNTLRYEQYLRSLRSETITFS